MLHEKVSYKKPAQNDLFNFLLPRQISFLKAITLMSFHLCKYRFLLTCFVLENPWQTEGRLIALT